MKKKLKHEPSLKKPGDSGLHSGRRSRAPTSVVLIAQKQCHGKSCCLQGCNVLP